MLIPSNIKKMLKQCVHILSQACVCDWWAEHSEVRAADIARARKVCLAESGTDDDILRTLIRLGAVRDEEVAQAYSTLLAVPRLFLATRLTHCATGRADRYHCWSPRPQRSMP